MVNLRYPDYAEYVRDHFQHLVYSSLVYNLRIPKFYNNLPITFCIICKWTNGVKTVAPLKVAAIIIQTFVRWKSQQSQLNQMHRQSLLGYTGRCRHAI